jgi:hypothetical protein
MKKFLRRLMLFAILFWCLNSAGSLVLAPRLKLNVWDKYHWILQKQGEQYDVVFVGSSRVMNSIDPIVVDQHSGYQSINIGIGGSGAADQFLVIQQYLKSNSADVVFLQIDWGSLMNYFSYAFRDYIWLSYDDDPLVRNTICDESGNFRYLLWRGIPFLRLMEFSSQYRFFLMDAPPTTTTYSETRGCVRLNGHKMKPDTSFKTFQESESSVNYLHRIIALCRDRKIPVVCFQSPYSSHEQAGVDRRVTDAAISEFVNNEGVIFWDFSRELYDRPDLFFDSAHLNSEGVDVFSRILGERISAEQSAWRVKAPTTFQAE